MALRYINGMLVSDHISPELKTGVEVHCRDVGIPEPYDLHSDFTRDEIIIGCWCGWRKVLTHLMIEQCMIPNIHARDWEAHYLNCSHALAIWEGGILLDVKGKAA